MQRTYFPGNGDEMTPDWNAITEAVARQLKGEPNARLSSRRELRWGSHGSFKLAIDGQNAGLWNDWEAGEGGRGAIRLAAYLLGTDRDGALDWLRQSGYLSGRPVAPSSGFPRTEPSVKRQPRDRSAVARSIWESSRTIPRDNSHPARRWFANRHLWRDELPAPPMLRWHQPGWYHTGIGSIVAALATPEAWSRSWPSVPEPVAVQIICIDESGDPALDKPADQGGMGKRTLGTAAGAAFVIGNPILPEAFAPVRATEGVADALAIAARYDGPVVAVTGTSGMRNPELAAWLATSPTGIIIHADSDGSHQGRAPAGTTAAGFLRQAVVDAGGTSSAVYPPAGYKDAADAAQAAGFRSLGDDWIEFARTLAETTDWPRWEIARIAQIVTTGA